MSGPMWTFEAAPDGAAYVVALDEAERGVLLEAVGDVIDLLGGASQDPSVLDADPDADAEPPHPLDTMDLGAEPVDAPQDPALLRLLPDAYRDAPEGAAEFRRLTEADLRSTKIANLRNLQEGLAAPGELMSVGRPQAPQVAAALTDLRLVLSERLGIRTDADADAIFELVTQGGELPSDGVQAVRRFLATLYTMLGMLQESLVGLMIEDLPPAARR